MLTDAKGKDIWTVFRYTQPRKSQLSPPLTKEGVVCTTWLDKVALLRRSLFPDPPPAVLATVTAAPHPAALLSSPSAPTARRHEPGACSIWPPPTPRTAESGFSTLTGPHTKDGAVCTTWLDKVALLRRSLFPDPPPAVLATVTAAPEIPGCRSERAHV